MFEIIIWSIEPRQRGNWVIKFIQFLPALGSTFACRNFACIRGGHLGGHSSKAPPLKSSSQNFSAALWNHSKYTKAIKNINCGSRGFWDFTDPKNSRMCELTQKNNNCDSTWALVLTQKVVQNRTLVPTRMISEIDKENKHVYRTLIYYDIIF